MEEGYSHRSILYMCSLGVYVFFSRSGCDEHLSCIIVVSSHLSLSSCAVPFIVCMPLNELTLTLARAVLLLCCLSFCRSVPPPCPTHRYLSANKKMKSKSKKEGKDGASEAGVVLKIYVENFMCHRKLSVPLCRRVLVLVQLLYTWAFCLG